MTAPAIRIRDAGLADLPAVMTVMDGAFDPFFNEAWSKPQVQGILGMPRAWLLVAEHGDVPAGFALGRLVVDEGELLLLGVRPGFRRQGIAAALVARAKALCMEAGASRLFLEMRDGNPAIDLYRRSGFAPLGRRPAYYKFRSGETCDALTLSCQISS